MCLARYLVIGIHLHVLLHEYCCLEAMCKGHHSQQQLMQALVTG